MATHYRILLIWVIGHRDIKAGELARIGTTIEILIDEDTIGIPLATCKMRINQNMIKLAQHIWNNNPTCSSFTRRLKFAEHIHNFRSPSQPNLNWDAVK